MKTKLLVLFIFALTVCLFAQPDKISYQGILTDNSNNLITGTKDLKFDIFDASSGGVAIWNETHTGVTVTNGLFSVELGATNTLNSVDFTQNLWLQITVDASTTPVALSPRVAFNATGYPLFGNSFDQINPMTEQGDIMYGTSSGYAVLGKGTAGQVLTMNGGATEPVWATPSGASSSYGYLKMTAAGTSSTGAEVNFGAGDTPSTLMSGFSWNNTNQEITVSNNGVYSILLSLHVQYLMSTWVYPHVVYNIYVNNVAIYTSGQIGMTPQYDNDIFSHTILHAANLTAGDKIRITFDYVGSADAIRLAQGSSLLINKL